MNSAVALRQAPAQDIAGNIAEAVRAFNEATRPGRGCPGLPDTEAAYEALGTLAVTAERLEQSLTQICSVLHRETQAGRLAGSDPIASVAIVGDTLDASAAAAAELARLIGRSQLLAERLTAQPAHGGS